MPCISRITSEDLKLPFGDEKHWFYLESACGDGCEDRICSKCLVKAKTNVQGSRKFDHGCVDGPYTAGTHIFDSPWYHKALKSYGAPREEVLQKAMETQKKARGGKKIAVEKEVKESTPKTPKTPKVRKLKVVETPLETPVEIVPETATHAETMDEPISVSEVIKVILKPFTHKSVDYWRDYESEKLYKRLVKGKGPYVGRWNSELEQVDTEAPDSDGECV
jgi:hypothetical protein